MGHDTHGRLHLPSSRPGAALRKKPYNLQALSEISSESPRKYFCGGRSLAGVSGPQWKGQYRCRSSRGANTTNGLYRVCVILASSLDVIVQASVRLKYLTGWRTCCAARPNRSGNIRGIAQKKKDEQRISSNAGMARPCPTDNSHVWTRSVGALGFAKSGK